MATTMEYGGFCACGCGQKTELAKRNHSVHGWTKGEPYEFVPGHQNHGKRKGYDEKDCGYTTPCHVWRGQPSQRYPSIKVKGMPVKVHIYTWEQAWGPVPDGLVVHHRCDNPRCCNLEHLGVVTGAMNAQLSPKAKLSAGKADSLRRLYATGAYTHQKLAELFEVSPSAVGFVLSGRTYRKWQEHKPARPARRKDD